MPTSFAFLASFLLSPLSPRCSGLLRESRTGRLGFICRWSGGAIVSTLSVRVTDTSNSTLLRFRSLPLGVVGGLSTLLIGKLPFKYFPLKYRLVVGALLGAGSAVLLAFGRTSDKYYSHLLPAFIFGPGESLRPLPSTIANGMTADQLDVRSLQRVSECFPSLRKSRCCPACLRSTQA
jgi:hypothetical protein